MKKLCYNDEKIGCDFMVKEATKDGMHIEYHSAKKKDKAANCVHLTEDRICYCKPCYCYLGYCYDSTHCPYKEKEETKNHNSTKHKKRIVDIDCSLPEGTIVHGRGNKIGVVHHYEKKGRKLYITFGKGKIECLYPESFQHGALKLDDEAHGLLASDIAKAKVE